MDGFSVLLKYFPPPAFKCCLSLRGCTGTCVTALSFQPETGSNSRLSKEKKKRMWDVQAHSLQLTSGHLFLPCAQFAPF